MPRSGKILIIEDDPEVRDHLELFLTDEGYAAATADRRTLSLATVGDSRQPPDLVLADYNLPNGMNGVEVSQTLRRTLDRQIPFIILTGDISTDALRNIALHDCVQFNKPVKLRELTHAIDKLLAQPTTPAVVRPAQLSKRRLSLEVPKIYVVDDDDQVSGGDRRRAGG